MNKINFLNDNKNSGSTDDLPNGQEGGEELDIKWTSPEKITPSGKSNDPAAKISGTINRIKSRLHANEADVGAREPLAGDNNFKSQPSDLEITDKNSGEKIKKSGFLGKFLSFNKSPNNAGHEFKNKKEMIAGYRDVFNDEKKLRKNFDEISGPNEGSYQENTEAEKSRPEIEGNKNLSGYNKWNAPKILKTDLIKDEVTVFIDWRKNINNILANLALAVFIIALAYFGLELWGRSSAQQVKTLDNEIREIAQKINKLNVEIKEIDTFQKKLNLSYKIIGQHIYWTNFFNFLEKNTLPNIIYTGGFKGDTSGKYSFAALAPSFNDLTDQIRVFKNDTENVTAVDVLKGTFSAGDANNQATGKKGNLTNIEFNMSLSVNPKIFSK